MEFVTTQARLRTAICLIAFLSMSAALSVAIAKETHADVDVPRAIAGQDYSLVKNWHFGQTVQTYEDLRDEFHTRFIYGGGTLDTLAANGEWQRYKDNDNHQISDRSLSLVAHLRGGLRPGGIESGMLRSKWSGKYGYFECRIKVPAGRGFWPACWLNPEDGKHPPEVDIVELVDNGRDDMTRSFHFVHPGKGSPATVLYSRLTAADAFQSPESFANGFHTFAVEWTPERVRHFIDDVLVVDRAFSWRHDDGSDGGDAHLLVNLAVGGRWPGAPLFGSQFPARLEIEYLRIWQKGAAETP